MRHLLILLLLLPLQTVAAERSTSVYHELMVQLKPHKASITVTDSMRIPAALISDGKVRFSLAAGLQLDSAETSVRKVEEGDASRQFYEARTGKGGSLVISYSGTWPQAPADDEGAGGISAEGVFLSAADYWFATFDSSMVSFDLTVALPGGWDAVSQGARRQHTRRKRHTLVSWREHQPQDDIYLVAGSFTEYTQKADGISNMVFLRQPDEALAERYMQATASYLQLYQELIGPYPYAKFALVENYRQTGFGMPSFTLLGSKVIRLPFIVYSSYPHEILHNWWGNGVFVDYASGNWAEGLTAYLADHLFQEHKGQAAFYRRDNLQKYADFAHQGRDFPLVEFVSRHSQASMAVGYGKTMMMFHMLRLRLGDEKFIAGLQAFYGAARFRRATFADLADAFSHSAGEDLQGFFRQWTTRAGAPLLALDEVSASAMEEGGAYRLQGVLQQLQDGEPWTLQVPVMVELAGQAPLLKKVDMSQSRQDFSFEVPARPLRIVADPAFDVFRLLHAAEIPAALSQGFGGEKILVLLASAERVQWRNAWQDMLSAWQRYMHLPLEIRLDSEVQELPADRPVWLLGWDNLHRDKFIKAALQHGISYDRGQGRLAGNDFNRNSTSLVAAVRHPHNPANTLLWLASHDTTAIGGLARKLPRYSKYSYLLFQGQEPVLQAKGQWPVTDSPMLQQLDGSDGGDSVALPPRSPLVPAAQQPQHQ